MELGEVALRDGVPLSLAITEYSYSRLVSYSSAVCTTTSPVTESIRKASPPPPLDEASHGCALALIVYRTSAFSDASLSVAWTRPITVPTASDSDTRKRYTGDEKVGAYSFTSIHHVQ